MRNYREMGIILEDDATVDSAFRSRFEILDLLRQREQPDDWRLCLPDLERRPCFYGRMDKAPYTNALDHSRVSSHGLSGLRS